MSEYRVGPGDGYDHEAAALCLGCHEPIGRDKDGFINNRTYLATENGPRHWSCAPGTALVMQVEDALSSGITLSRLFWGGRDD